VLLGARYEGRVHGDVIQFDGQFSAYCCSDGPVSLAVPLAGVMLRGATLDGKPAYPRPGAGPDRFAFELTGKGPHSLALQFDVSVAGTTDREARFGIPELAASHVVLHLPRGACRPQALSWRGAQRVTDDRDGQTLEADLGRVAAAQVRWREPGAGDSPPAGPVQEIILWDVDESQARVRAVFRHRLGTGYAARLDYDLPPEWEPASASVRPVDDRAAAVGVIGVKEWARFDQPGTSRLGLEFQTPLTGHVQVSMELIPKRPLALSSVLPLPRAAGAGDRETLVGVRLRGWEGDVAETPGLGPASADAFRDLWQSLRADQDRRRPAFTFRRTGGAASLRLVLRPPAPTGRGDQDLTWRVGPGRAELWASAKWPDPPPSGLLEWHVPADVTVVELRGPGVRSWSRAGSRVQVWLDRAAPPAAADKGASLELIARKPLPIDAAALGNTGFVLPPVFLLGVATQTAAVTVQAADGWRVFPTNVAAFHPMLTADLPGFRWAGTTADPAARADFRLAPARGAADFDLVTVAESDGRQFVFTTTIDVVPPPGKGPEPNSVVVEVRHAAGPAPHFDLPAEAKLREARPGADGGTWVIDFAPGRHRLTITVRRPVPTAGDLQVPVVTARAAGPAPGRSRHWVALAGGNLRARAPAGLRIPPAGDLPADAKLRDALAGAATAWRVDRDDWGVNVRASPPAGPPPTVPVEASAAVDGTGHWLMEVRYFIVHESDARWGLIPDDDGPVLSVTVDGRPSPERPAAGRIPLLLPPAPGAHEVRAVFRSPVRWDADHLPLRLPRLTAAGDAVPVGPVVWSVTPPPGRGVELPAGIPVFGRAARDLRQAAQLDGLAGRAAPDAVRSIELRIDQLLKDAQVRLAAGPAADLGPDGQPLPEWLKQLRDRHPPRSVPPRPPRPPFDESFEWGEALAFQTPDATAPPVRLTSTDGVEPWRWVATMLLVGLSGVAAAWGRRGR
jgi:hypothetical protein